MKKRLFCKVGIIAVIISVMLSLSPTSASEKTSRWMKFGNEWSYLEDGKWKIGWFNDNPTGMPRDDRWYYFDQNGVMKKGWLYWKNEWYYLGMNGMMCDGWVKDNGKWYYLNRWSRDGLHGNMKRDELFDAIGGVYYLGDDGSMVTDTTIKGFHFGSDGRNDRKDVIKSFTQMIDYAKTLGFTLVKENSGQEVESIYSLKKNLINECEKDEFLINKLGDRFITISTNGFCHSENYDELNKIIKSCVPSISDEIITYIGNPSHDLSLKGKTFFGDGRYIYVYTKDVGGSLNYEKGQLVIEIK